MRYIFSRCEGYLGINRDEGFDSNSTVEDSDQNNDEISSNFTNEKCYSATMNMTFLYL